MFDDVDSGPIAFGVAVGTATYWMCSIAVTQIAPIIHCKCLVLCSLYSWEAVVYHVQQSCTLDH